MYCTATFTVPDVHPSHQASSLVFGVRLGQIVVFNSPTDPGRIVVKRVMGLPGDRMLVGESFSAIRC